MLYRDDMSYINTNQGGQMNGVDNKTLDDIRRENDLRGGCMQQDRMAQKLRTNNEIEEIHWFIRELCKTVDYHERVIDSLCDEMMSLRVKVNALIATTSREQCK